MNAERALELWRTRLYLLAQEVISGPTRPEPVALNDPSFDGPADAAGYNEHIATTDWIGEYDQACERWDAMVWLFAHVGVTLDAHEVVKAGLRATS